MRCRSAARPLRIKAKRRPGTASFIRRGRRLPRLHRRGPLRLTPGPCNQEPNGAACWSLVAQAPGQKVASVLDCSQPRRVDTKPLTTDAPLPAWGTRQGIYCPIAVIWDWRLVWAGSPDHCGVHLQRRNFLEAWRFMADSPGFIADLWPQLFSNVNYIALWISSEKILTRLYSVLHWFHKRREVNIKNSRENLCFQTVIVFSFGSVDNSSKCTVLWKITARLITVSTSVNNEMWVKLRVYWGGGAPGTRVPEGIRRLAPRPRNPRFSETVASLTGPIRRSLGRNRENRLGTRSMPPSWPPTRRTA